MRSRNQLVVFVRAPQLGGVKRRLATAIGDVAAWQFYRRSSEVVLRRVSRAVPWHCWLFVTPDEFAYAGRYWPDRVARLPQGPGDLGERMTRALISLPPGPLVIIGSDIPDIAAGHVCDAFAALRSHDVVFGPAPDGGYWLVGMNCVARRASLFRDVRWSTEFALDDTRRNLACGQSSAVLEVLEDIDDWAAFDRWRHRLE